MRILVTGGAGFVGANLAVALAARRPEWSIVAFDSLRRRGSELNLARLQAGGVAFVHGDVREGADLLALDPIDALVECSAEPSMLAGIEGSPKYPVHTNLLGAFNCLELARRDAAQVVFLSTSRVYPVSALCAVRYLEGPTRLELVDGQELPGISSAGVSEQFPLDGPRTLYGATKLGAELLIGEYGEGFGVRSVINRCGVIAGPWQMGKVDQGIFSYWMLAHYFGRNLRYIGFCGTGKQVRDLLHISDLVDLIEDQLVRPEHWAGVTANVGGGADCSLSLQEATALCAEITGNRVAVESSEDTRPGDVPIYIGDSARLFGHTDWRPRRSAREILEDIFAWIRDNERAVRLALAP